MKGFMIRGLSWLAFSVLACTIWSMPGASRGSGAQADGPRLVAQADGQKPGDKAPGDQKSGDQKSGDQKSGGRRGLQFQELEDPIEFMEPVRRRTVTDEARL